MVGLGKLLHDVTIAFEEKLLIWSIGGQNRIIVIGCARHHYMAISSLVLQLLYAVSDLLCRIDGLLIVAIVFTSLTRLQILVELICLVANFLLVHLFIICLLHGRE